MKFRNLLNQGFKKSIAKDKEVVAVLLFGSHARNEEYKDIDICVFLDKKYSNLHMSRKRLEYSSLFSNKYDVHVFQQLPVYIRKRILKDGKIIVCKNEDLLYEIAFATIKEFNTYSKIYYNYLESMKE